RSVRRIGGGAGIGIEDRGERRRGRQRPLPKRRARHEPKWSRRRVLPKRLVVREEEAAVLYDRSAKITAELILVQRRQGSRAEWPAGVHPVIAVELEPGTVKRVCTRFGDNVDLPAAAGAALRGVDSGIDAEFGDRIERDAEPRIRFLRLLLDAGVVDAIEGIV